MQRRNDLCALANSRRNPLDGFRADISDGEDAPPVGFQRMAIAAGIFVPLVASACTRLPFARSATLQQKVETTEIATKS
jgi:hypothetical protein